MRDKLAYQAPERLQELIRSEIGDAAGLEILDLGCGTGLAGVGLKERAARLVGIDLSPEMIAFAGSAASMIGWRLPRSPPGSIKPKAQFDLIVACDCLVYFGDLQRVVEMTAKLLKPGGCFAFTVERGQRYPFHLTDSGRFTHHPNHIREIAANSRLLLARLEEGFLRTERGLEVTGLLALLRKSGEA